MAQAFSEVIVRSETRPFSFESFDDYFSGIAAGAGFAGQEDIALPKALQQTVREAVRLSFADEGTSQPFVVEMEVLVGSGRAARPLA